MRLVKLGLISILASGALFAGTYNLDKSHSSVGFKVKHMMISNVKGTFDNFKGSFEYDEKTKKLTALTGTIDAASINTANKKRDDHLRSADFFDTAKYPELTFVLKKVQGDTVHGDLTMHGVTKSVKLELENNGSVKDPWGNTRVGLSLEGKIDRKEFGLVYNSILEAGGVAIGDKVKLEIELEGILKKVKVKKMKNPVFYLSHGAPNMVLYESRTKENFRKLEKYLNSAEYIIIVSAHWESRGLYITDPNCDKLMYDFYGFEKELYEYKYDIKSDPVYSKKVFDALKEFDISYDHSRKSFDHGVWSVLAMITPEVRVPVVQISLPVDFSVEKLIGLGEKLKPLRDKALIICSGSLTHNLRDMERSNTPKDYVMKFNDKVVELLKEGDIDSLKDINTLPYIKQNHFTLEHFLPLYIALGASDDHKGESINREFIYSTVSMESFIFKE